MMISTGLLRLPPLRTLPTSQRLRRFAEGVSLWLAVLLLLFVHPLYADAAQWEERQAGELHFLDTNGNRQGSALILGTGFDIRVSGLIADSHLTRSFRNPGDQWREGVFVFPLPEKASVYGLVMKVGERTIVGRVQPKAEARKTYEKAKAAGQHAANVEQQRPNLFTARVANIPPGETVTIDLRYQQVVDYRAGVFELRLPTTLTPRYMPGTPVRQTPRHWQGGWSVPTTEVPDAEAISPFTVQTTDVSPDSHRASVHVQIDAGLPLAQVVSPSHALETRMDGQVADIRPAGGPMVMDRDFVLRWQPLAGREPSAAVFHQRWQEQDYLLAMVVPGLAGSEVLPRELIFVIDTSGSMAGTSIRQAKSALQRGLDTLKPGDSFNIIRFDNEAHALFPVPQSASAGNLDLARRYVDRLQANGGTEMARALNMALAQAPETEVSAELVRQVVFITDGAVGNEEALFNQIRMQLGSRRLFTVGIGSAPNMHFMREAARWGRGSYTAIADSSEVGAPLQQLFAAMEAPVLTGIQVQWPDQQARAESYPQRTGDLFQGEPLVQVVRGVAPAGEMTVSGTLPGGQVWERSLDLQQAAEGTGLHRHWAREKLDSELDQARSQGREPDKAGLTALAVSHGLMSPYTSFVAVDETPARPRNQPLKQESVPTLLPAGASQGMLRYPGTATFGPLFTALGLVGLMFSGALGLLRRRRLS